MMGQVEHQEQLFYRLRLEDYVPEDHLLRRVDQLVDFSGLRTKLAALYSHTGRPSVDPELMIRMLLVGYLCGIRSETRLCKESAFEPRLSLVLPSRPRRGGARALDFFQEPAWAFRRW
mgnify:CR=1 FL=1